MTATTSHIPTLATERLVLRAPEAEDFPGFAAFWASHRSRYMGGPTDEAGAWFWFCSDTAQWHLFGHGAFSVTRSDAGDVIGQVGINAGPLLPERELGWLLYAGHEGRGYALEAAAAARDWAFATLGFGTLVSYIDPKNRASVRLAERLGAVSDPAAPRQPGDPDDLVYRHAPEAASWSR